MLVGRDPSRRKKKEKEKRGKSLAFSEYDGDYAADEQLRFTGVSPALHSPSLFSTQKYLK